jgi:hypothetical protein
MVIHVSCITKYYMLLLRIIRAKKTYHKPETASKYRRDKMVKRETNLYIGSPVYICLGVASADVIGLREHDVCSCRVWLRPCAKSLLQYLQKNFFTPLWEFS